MADVEVISLSLELFRRLGLRNLEAVINSVGCEKCRPVYRRKLVDYFTSRRDSLCETCLDRLSRNPLRILDCKKESCGHVADGAPDIFDSLCDECREHFAQVRAGLERLGFTYRLNKRLVRGLDYYTKTAYEILSGDLGAQNAVAGGGRYDNLASAIGGGKVPGVGFACGVDRIMLVMEEQGCSFGQVPKTQVYCAALDEDSRAEVQALTYELRKAGISAECDTSGRSFKAQMKNAGTSEFACIIGESERESNSVSIKDMKEGTQTTIPMSEAVKYLRERL